ncbi:MAG: hypothetical protein QXO94_06405 [Candidatus Bathyarchaeia archaeon]
MERKITKIISLLFLLLLSTFLVLASSLSVPQPSLSLNPEEGPPSTLVSVFGVGFTPSTSYKVYFDIDGDERQDYDDPDRYVMTDSSGSFTTILKVPSVASGLYYIRADDLSCSPPAIASKAFNVKSVWEKLLEIQDEISDIKAELEDKPKIFEVWCYKQNLTSGDFCIHITSTENFQVKAIYVAYYGDQGEYIETKDWYDTMCLGDARHNAPFWIAVRNSAVEILPYHRKELLSWIGVDLPPAGEAYDVLFIILHNHGDGIWDTLYVKVIVESAQNANVELNVFPYP